MRSLFIRHLSAVRTFQTNCSDGSTCETRTESTEECILYIQVCPKFTIFTMCSIQLTDNIEPVLFQKEHAAAKCDPPCSLLGCYTETRSEEYCNIFTCTPAPPPRPPPPPGPTPPPPPPPPTPSHQGWNIVEIVSLCSTLVGALIVLVLFAVQRTQARRNTRRVEDNIVRRVTALVRGGSAGDSDDGQQDHLVTEEDLIEERQRRKEVWLARLAQFLRPAGRAATVDVSGFPRTTGTHEQVPQLPPIEQQDDLQQELPGQQQQQQAQQQEHDVRLQAEVNLFNHIILTRFNQSKCFLMFNRSIAPTWTKSICPILLLYFFFFLRSTP